MKKMNRRTFLALSGASVALLALAACGDAHGKIVVDGSITHPAMGVLKEPITIYVENSFVTKVEGGEEAKVLQAINKYRAAAGVKEQIALDDGLKPAAEIVVKIAKGEMTFDEKAAEALGKAEAGYDVPGGPIGIAFDKDTGNMMPVCVYSEDAEKMAQNLPLQVDESAKENLKSASLITIQLFEYGGVKYWVAVAAKGKVKP